MKLKFRCALRFRIRYIQNPKTIAYYIAYKYIVYFKQMNSKFNVIFLFCSTKSVNAIHFSFFSFSLCFFCKYSNTNFFFQFFFSSIEMVFMCFLILKMFIQFFRFAFCCIFSFFFFFVYFCYLYLMLIFETLIA